MASSSDSVTSKWQYDVFLSFRGADTRKGFTDHLYSALVRDGIHTFRDANEIETGEEIGAECLQAIQRSRFSIAILSKGFASSSWCLDELVHILKCRKELGHIVWPVFYDIDPSDVEDLKGSFGEAFVEHEKNCKDDVDKVEDWKDALREVAYLKGLDLQKHFDGHEAENIDYIVKEIADRLDKTMLRVATHPVGLHSPAEKVISLLDNESVRAVGLYGMGGIGKTTIAKNVYNLVCREFEGSCFLENVRHISISKGIDCLQRQLLSAILKREHAKIDNISRGLNVIKDRLCCLRILIVLDDIDKLELLDQILGNFDWFSQGSKVIITSRTKDLLQPSNWNRQYEVEELDDSDSLQLLSLYAFNQRHPPEDYMDCARKVVSYSRGIPLVLEVLGSSLYGQCISVWNSRLEKLKVIGNGDINSKLKISYDSLDDTERFIFLDIACFFIGYDKDYVMSILDGCGFFPIDGINALKRRCLVKVDNKNKLLMHDLLRDMGREIVRQESTADPGGRSRLWHEEDVIDVLIDRTGTKAVEGLVLNILGVNNSFNTKAFKKMKKLRLLQLNSVCLKGNYAYVSSKLSWLCWLECPLKVIPAELLLQHLIALDMRYSSLQQFSEEVKSLVNLKLLDLSHSHKLNETPNFECSPRLENIELQDCISLEKVHESIGLLKHLQSLNLQDCKSLKNLPKSICALSSLTKLDVSGCSKLEELPEDLGNMQSLVVLLAGETAISMLPETIGDLQKLEKLSLYGCHLISSPRKHPLTDSFLPSLQKLILSYCNILDDMIPNDLQGLSLLSDLELSGNNFTSLPANIGRLPKLKNIWLSNCRRLQYIPELPPSVEFLAASLCSSLEVINLRNFRGEGYSLSLSGCSKLKAVEGYFNLEPLPTEIVEKLRCMFTEDSLSSTKVHVINTMVESATISPLQALSDKSVYSIFLPTSEISTWFSHQREGDRVSLVVPPLDHDCKIGGFSISTVYGWESSLSSCFVYPTITVINRTKMFHWEYNPKITFFRGEVEEDMMWLSCWFFANQIQGIDDLDLSWRFQDELEEGDILDVLIDIGCGIVVKRCGIHLLYHHNDLQVSQSNDLLASISHAHSSKQKHYRRVQHPHPMWLTFDHPRITLGNGRENQESWSRWREKRVQRLNETPIEPREVPLMRYAAW